MSPLLMKEVVVKATRVAIAYCPAVLVLLLRLLIVVPEAVNVTTPVPVCTIIQLNPAGRVLGTVRVMALELFMVMILPLSVVVSV